MTTLNIGRQPQPSRRGRSRVDRGHRSAVRAMNWRQIGRDALVFVAVLACCAVLVVSAKHVADWWLW